MHQRIVCRWYRLYSNLLVLSVLSQIDVKRPRNNNQIEASHHGKRRGFANCVEEFTAGKCGNTNSNGAYYSEDAQDAAARLYWRLLTDERSAGHSQGRPFVMPEVGARACPLELLVRHIQVRILEVQGHPREIVYAVPGKISGGRQFFLLFSILVFYSRCERATPRFLAKSAASLVHTY